MAEYIAELQSTTYEAELAGTEYSAELSEVIKVITDDFEELTATATEETQVIMPHQGYAAFSKVTINPIPSNYGLITWNGSIITVS